MSHLPKFLGLLAFIAALITTMLFDFGMNGTGEKTSPLIKSDLIKEDAELERENELLKEQNAGLKEQNSSLKKYLYAYENNFIALKDATRKCNQDNSELIADLPAGLSKESFEIRQFYLEMLGEKKRWDQYQQEQYIDILEDTVEPHVIEVQSLRLENQENLEHFIELESDLKLHRRLIRDVRLFHDEIQYQKKQLLAQHHYQLYVLKFELAPFARESALVDALQQAMSALSAGIYQKEAEEVLDRIGEELTKPIRQLYEQQQDAKETLAPTKYQYNLYTVYGKKLMDYSETLARQSSITLGPLAFGELDYFNRQLYDSLYDLYQIGQDEAIDSSHLDLEELENFLCSRY